MQVNPEELDPMQISLSEMEVGLHNYTLTFYAKAHASKNLSHTVVKNVLNLKPSISQSP